MNMKRFFWLRYNLLRKSQLRKWSITKCLVFALAFSVASLVFLSYYVMTFNTRAMKRQIPQVSVQCQFKKAPNKFSPGDHYSTGELHIDYKVLVIVETQYSRHGQDIIYILESLRIKYKVEPAGKTLPYLTHGEKGKYAIVIFENFETYISMDAWNRELLDKYCRDYNVGIIGFLFSKDDTIYSKQIREFPLSFQQYVSLEDYELNPTSNIWRITRPGEVLKGLMEESDWTIFHFNHSTYKPLASAKASSVQAFESYSELSSSTVIPAVQDLGKLDRIVKIIFGNGLKFWLHRLMFMDCVSYLSHGKLSLPLERYVQIDIDDVFVGARGRRMKVADVEALLAAQTRLRNLIEGFRFNLGFSGKYYQKGTLEENLGDQRLLENKNKFWWFPHMWRHEQPHKFLQPALERAMLQNFLFAKKHNITVDQHYAVAPHHSGVFPVHKPLYDSWQNVWNISVTSTEEYPHLHPARRRRGFKHKGIKVLPRQTCGLYTHNLFIDQYPGGRHRLEGSIQGGELFQTFLFNLVNIFMTHMCNYGNDRLALYTFESVVKFLHCWTNLKLKARKPLELAKIYFSTYPEEEDPIWLNPCRDKRHLAIWSASKTCKSLPDFIVIGPQKTGTTALYLFIKMHPLIISNNAHPFIFEELHFFSTSRFYRKGLDWYMDSFPVVNKSSKFLLFEKSADYFDSNLAPLRAAALVPNAKLICILQDPIKRAYSWYHHARAHKSPASLNYTFLEVITADERSPRILKDLRNRCLNPGMYAQHLERWLTFFPSSQLLIIDGEEVRENPVLTMDKVQKFLQVHKHIDYSSLLRYDSRKGFFCQVLSEDRTRCLGPGKGRQYPTIDLHSKKHLKQLYRRHNVALSKLLIKLNQIAPLWLQNNLRDMQ